MKISETGNSPAELISRYKVDGKKTDAESEKQASGGVVAEEKVSLSTAAQDFQKAQKALNELPDVREEKVQELKDKIKAEGYDINGEKIAEKMVGESLLDIIA